MKTSCLIFFFHAFTLVLKCQNTSKSVVRLAIGTIRNQVVTESENSKIRGLPTFDFLPELSYRRTIISNSSVYIGLQVPSLSTKFTVDQSSQYEPNQGDFRSLTNKSGYINLFVCSEYSIPLNKKISIRPFIGPMLLYSLIIGLDDHQTIYSASATQTYTVTFMTSYEVVKTRRWSYGVRAGINCEINLKRRALFLSAGYNKGFLPFSQNEVVNNINGMFNDRAKILSFGSGFFFVIGVSLPTNNSHVEN